MWVLSDYLTPGRRMPVRRVLLGLVVLLQFAAVLIFFTSDLWTTRQPYSKTPLSGSGKRETDRGECGDLWGGRRQGVSDGWTLQEKPLTPAPIPAIIHQMWETERVPRMFALWMKSWASLHPNWAYWFWTPADGRRLVATHYHHLEDVYNAYPDSLHRAHVLRLLVLHCYGGVYADLDVRPLRSLEAWRTRGSFLLSREPVEHTYFHSNSTQPQVMNTIMAARPGHPFLAHVLSELRAARFNSGVANTTGIGLFNSAYRRYITTGGSKDMPPEDKVTALDPKYLLPTYDRRYRRKLWKACKIKTRYKRLSPEKQAVCKKHVEEGWENRPGPQAYTDHYWCHAKAKPTDWSHEDTVLLHYIAPQRQNLRQVV